MNLLYNDEFVPITTTAGFLATDLESAVNAYASWMGHVEAQHGRQLKISRAAGSLRDVLASLLPLTSPVFKKASLVPTNS